MWIKDDRPLHRTKQVYEGCAEETVTQPTELLKNECGTWQANILSR